MAILFKDRVQDTSTDTGTGNFTIANSAPSGGFQTFNSAYGTGSSNKFYYCIQGGNEWEVGIGYLDDATTLVRETILGSSNSNSEVGFSAGDKTVFSTAAANFFTNTGNVVVKRFTTAGTTSWTPPDGVTEGLVEAWGAGGGGGGGDSDNEFKGAGGGGGEYRAAFLNFTPATAHDVVVGTGGTAGTGGVGTATNGGNGGDSYFGDGSGLLANGGNGGESGSDGSPTGGTGGSGGVGLIASSNGSNGADETAAAGGAAGGASTSAVAGILMGKWGGAGTASTTNSAVGAAGNIIGGGGAGGGWSGNRSGGAGARGEVRITYLAP